MLSRPSSALATIFLAAGLATAAAQEDQQGRSALMTPEKALEAVSLIDDGEVISLGRTYEPGMPLFGARVFALRGTPGLAGGPVGDNKTVWMDDFLATEIGQVGTQFDGLGHIGIGHDDGSTTFYGDREGAEVMGAYGLNALGIEQVKPFFTRGVLFDIAGLRGRQLEAGEEITAADLEAALERQGVEPPGEGDVAVIHTGWGSLWMVDNETYNSGEPGIGMDAARWLIDRGVAVIGADTWAVEVVPNPEPGQVFPVHQETLARNGVFLHENLATERLVDAGVNEFAYIFSPVPIKGATGSPGNPLAAH